VQQKGAQQATVRGHGRIDLLDQKTGKCPLHASWKESFATSRDEPLDVLTLVGNAKMIDDEHKQVLAGDRLQIWLQPGDEKGENDPQLNKSQGRRVHHLVATDHVFAQSPDMKIHQSKHLVVHFKDVPTPPDPSGGILAGSSKDAQATPSRPGFSGPADAPPPVPSPPHARGPIPDPGKAKAAEPNKPPRPIEISARGIEAHVK